MFTTIRNGYAVNKKTVHIPFSKLKMEIAKLLLKNGYVKDITRKGKRSRRSIEVTLVYNDGASAISKIKRVSKPSRRVYISLKEIFPVHNGFGTMILSTPKGIMSDGQAKKEKVGGEVIGEVW